MLAPLLLLAVLILPAASSQNPPSVCVSKSSEREYAEWMNRDIRKFLAIVEELVNLTNGVQANVTQILIDLQILRGRQAVSGAVQGGQVFMFVAYLVTIAVFYLVKHCKKHQQEVARTEFELLEEKLQASRSKRRAAAARAGKQSPQ